MRFEFSTSSKILFGANTLKDVIPISKSLGNKAFLVLGKDTSRFKSFQESLRNEGIVLTIFSVASEPTLEDVCQGAALVKEEQGLIRIDEHKCNGCGWCILACRFGAITLHPTKRVAMTCDLCDGDPECVKLCPFEGALIFSTLDEEAHKATKGTAKTVLRELANARAGGSTRS